VHVPAARTVELALGSDDGFRLYLDAREVAGREVDRGLALDQDRAPVEFPAGTSTLVLKEVNTGGEGGFAFRAEPRADDLAGDLLLGLLPHDARTAEHGQRWSLAWQLLRSPAAREARARIAAIESRAAALEAAFPRTMVMRELPAPRETYVLVRGEYDKPDRARPVARGVPAALGAFPPDAPRDRLGLAQWLVAPENPLVARVAANRLVELVFGAGLVRTSEDFGLQGEWPTHKELLDWLAVRYQESGWDTRGLVRLLVTSATYRQASAHRPDLARIDPENRLLARFPRQRLPAEAVRDLALHASGLLVEELGGPSVKPYQPEGLWQEVAMPASNTRVYERGAGPDLWRRSLYTYWKRAAPPPTLLAFDAPTRESCTIRRATTNTPLQALALWNDPQFVEAARALAQRVLREECASDADRLERLVRRVTGARPEAGELADLNAALAGFRARYAAAPDDARALLEVGESPRDVTLDAGEHAAWTLVASAVLSLDAALTRD
jgi:hypothetical protein